jgi:hypothetical protein
MEDFLTQLGEVSARSRLDEISQLSNRVDDPRTPFKSKYAARQAIFALADALAALPTASGVPQNATEDVTLESEPPGDALTFISSSLPALLRADLITHLTLLAGVNYALTDEDSSAVSCLRRGLARLAARFAISTAHCDARDTEVFAPGSHEPVCPVTTAFDLVCGDDIPSALDFSTLSTEAVLRYAHPLILGLNTLGTIWANRSEFRRALLILKTAESAYIRFASFSSAASGSPDELASASAAGTVESASAPANYSTAPTVLSRDPARQVLPSTAADDVEALHTHTLFFLGQVLQGLGRSELSARYLGHTLERQRVSEASPVDPVQWTKDALGLATYYVSARAFARARQLLQRCDQMVSRAAADAADAADAAHQCLAHRCHCGHADSEDESFAECSALLGRAWGQFHREFLRASVETLESYNDAVQLALDSGVAPPSPPVKIAGSGSDADAETDADADLPDELRDIVLSQPALTLPISDRMPNLDAQKPECPVLTKQAARAVFADGLRGYNAALQYFVLDGHVTPHCEILIEIGDLYRLVAQFYDDDSAAAKLNELRARAIEGVAPQLSREHYDHLIRSLRYEAGSGYLAAFDRWCQSNSADAAVRARKAADAALEHLTSVCVSYDRAIAERNAKARTAAPVAVTDTPTAPPPAPASASLADPMDALDDEDASLYFTALFSIARLHVRFPTQDPHQNARHMRQAYASFDRVVRFADRRAAAQNPLPDVQAQVEHCREILGLLKQKLQEMERAGLL